MIRSETNKSSVKAGMLVATAIYAIIANPAYAQAVESDWQIASSDNANAKVNAERSDALADANGFSLSNENREVVTMGGNLDPFAGSLDPFGGSLDPFGGSLDPFGGSLDPFAGSLDPFGGSLDPFGGNLNPFHGEVRALWGSVDPYIDGINANLGQANAFWGDIDPLVGKVDPVTGVVLPSYVEMSNFWSDFGSDWRATNIQLNRIQELGSNWRDIRTLNNLIDGLIAKTDARWGDAIEARSGQSFEAAFLNPLFAKYGIGSDRDAGFLALTVGQRAQLVSEWFDGLNNYTGHNQLDHWMRTVNWTPELTKIQGSGADAVIGILDSSIVSGDEFGDNVFHSGGYAAEVGGHGIGVASLLIGAHDGEGVMGIAPNASVATYNPFDATGSASWTDIRNGIVSLKNAGASVINMSLGVSGWTFHSEWNEVFTHGQVKNVAKDTVFVIAAGNDGITQTENVEWQKDIDFGFIVVGAIDAVGNVSTMSNRPGSTCLVVKGSCSSGNYLKNHFIVAPGELLLVSDGHGGITRSTGTSFAAPLVSGAITLLHDRWPWLAQDPVATTQIILGSAKDLGEPGIDDVYGVGLLDVEASQSPLNFANLVYHEYKNGKKTARKSDAIRNNGVGQAWDTDGVFLTLFETVNQSQRDFVVPFSNQLVGQKSSVSGSEEYFQSYITDRFKDWSNNKNKGSFSDVASYATPNKGGWNFAISATNPTAYLSGGRQGEVPHSAIRISNEETGMKLSAGYGQGAVTLLGQNSFGLTSDYNSQSGGLNPLLGLASGGGFVDAEFGIAKNTTIAFGLTDRRLDHSQNPDLTVSERNELRNMRDYKASAFNMRIAHKPSQYANISLSFASLDENDGLLGVQSALDGDLRHGSNSKTLTLGGDIGLPHGFNISASATAALTKTNGGSDQNLTSRGNVSSSAFAVAVAKQGLVGKNDRLRLSFAQPLHVENGTLEYSSVEVIDRATGETGVVSRSFSIADTSRSYTGEFLYAAPIMDGGELSFFGRAELGATGEGDVNELIAGGMLTLPF